VTDSSMKGQSLLNLYKIFEGPVKIFLKKKKKKKKKLKKYLTKKTKNNTTTQK